MILFLLRHGHEADGFRGGWSDLSLDGIGREQSAVLAEHFAHKQREYHIKRIYSSDLPRAMQTAGIISDALHIPVISKSEFREVNNGALAGLDNDTAEKLYPGLYWKRLEWNECYPNGESPRTFYERISSAWRAFVVDVCRDGKNALLVTHGGVIQIILSILKGEAWSNKKNFGSVSCCDIVKLEIMR